MPRDDVAADLLVALEQRDDLALAAILHPGVRLIVDAGDATGGEVIGRARVGDSLANLISRHPDAALGVASVNGAPGLVVGGAPGVVAVLGIDVGAEGAITVLWLCTAPSKLARWS